LKKNSIMILVVVLIVVGAAVWYFTKPPAEPQSSYYVPGEYFITNIKGSRSLLKTTIVLALERDDREEFLTANNHIIRDIIVFTLREKTEEELRSSGIQDQLRKEIVAKLEERLEIDYIATIYFNDYILQ